MTQCVIKQIKLDKGKLLGIIAGRRLALAKFTGRIEITEERMDVTILGNRCKGEKRIIASIVLCEDVNYLSDERVYDGTVYEATGTVVRKDGVIEPLLLAGLQFEDSDPVEGTLTFSIPDLALIEKLLNL